MRRLLVMLSLLAVAVPLLAEEYEGKLQWHNKAALGFVVSGVIESVPAITGRRVKKGDPLVVLDQRGFEARAKQAATALEASKLDQAEAARELERAIELYERTQLSDHEKQMAEIGAAKARAELSKADAKKVEADLALEHSVLKAPFDALVVLVDAVRGQAVVSDLQSNPVVMVADANQMTASVLVPGSELKGLKIGAKARVRVEGKKIDAVIYSLGMEAWAGKDEDSESLYEIEILLTMPQDMLLREGMPVEVEL